MTTSRAPARIDTVRGPTTLLLAVTLLLTALNLRAAVTSVGAVLRDVQAALGMSDTAAGVLTSLPLVCFGVVGLLAARVSRRLGTDRTLIVALALITVGLVVRATAASVAELLATSLVALVGMGVGNVLVPVVVKAWFPRDVGRFTGLYSLGVVVGTAVPAAASVPLAQHLGGWRVALGIWALPAAVALLPWLRMARRRQLSRPPVVQPVASPAVVRIRRSPKAWALMVFFAVQGLEAYVVMGWLPTILQDGGLSPARAGLLASITLVLGAPVALLVPTLVARRPDQRPWVVLLTAASAFAYLGLLLAPTRAPLLWAVLLGIGLGAFPLALVLIGLRAVTPRGTAELSALVQGWGYLLAATGPLTVGLLHDLTGGWRVPLTALLVGLVPKLVAGWVAASPGAVDEPVVEGTRV